MDSASSVVTIAVAASGVIVDADVGVAVDTDGVVTAVVCVPFAFESASTAAVVLDVAMEVVVVNDVAGFVVVVVVYVVAFAAAIFDLLLMSLLLCRCCCCCF